MLTTCPEAGKLKPFPLVIGGPVFSEIFGKNFLLALIPSNVERVS